MRAFTSSSHLSEEELQTLLVWHCAVLSALPQSTIAPLQRVQNAAARLIFNLGRKEHVTPCLIQLHRLPVQFRITYKLCVIMHYIHVGKAPCYLSEALQLTSTRVTRSDLRSSSDTTSYTIPHLKTKFGERAFSFAGPVTWNSLLQNCAPYLTVLFLRTSSKPIFLIWLLTFSRFRLPLFVLLYCTYVLVL